MTGGAVLECKDHEAMRFFGREDVVQERGRWGVVVVGSRTCGFVGCEPKAKTVISNANRQCRGISTIGFS